MGENFGMMGDKMGQGGPLPYGGPKIVHLQIVHCPLSIVNY